MPVVPKAMVGSGVDIVMGGSCQATSTQSDSPSHLLFGVEIATVDDHDPGNSVMR
jgi:hypothetical protein